MHQGGEWSFRRFSILPPPPSFQLFQRGVVFALLGKWPSDGSRAGGWGRAWVDVMQEEG